MQKKEEKKKKKKYKCKKRKKKRRKKREKKLEICYCMNQMSFSSNTTAFRFSMCAQGIKLTIALERPTNVLILTII